MLDSECMKVSSDVHIEQYATCYRCTHQAVYNN